MSKRKYTVGQVDTISGLKAEFGWSVRKIAEETGIPKSVVGRWTKDPEIWKQKYQITAQKAKSNKLSPKVRKQLRKAIKHVSDPAKPTRHKLHLTIYEEDDTYSFNYA